MLFPGDGTEWSAAVAAVRGRTVTVEVSGIVATGRRPRPAVEIWCALVRPSRIEWAIEKCSEAGVDAFVPLLADNAARGEAPSAARSERWQRIAVEAAEQSGRLFLPAIHEPARLEDALRAGAWVAFADAGGDPLPVVLECATAPTTVRLLIGPEGGWSDRERELAARRGAHPVRLGPHTFRTETAAVVGAALIRALTGEAVS